MKIAIRIGLPGLLTKVGFAYNKVKVCKNLFKLHPMEFFVSSLTSLETTNFM